MADYNSERFFIYILSVLASQSNVTISKEITECEQRHLGTSWCSLWTLQIQQLTIQSYGYSIVLTL